MEDNININLNRELFEKSKLKADFSTVYLEGVSKLSNYEIYESLILELLDGLEELLLGTSDNPKEIETIKTQLTEQIIIYTLLQNDITDFSNIQKSQIDEIKQSIDNFKEVVRTSSSNSEIPEITNYNENIEEEEKRKEEKEKRKREKEEEKKAEEKADFLSEKNSIIIDQIVEECEAEEKAEAEKAAVVANQSNGFGISDIVGMIRDVIGGK